MGNPLKLGTILKLFPPLLYVDIITFIMGSNMLRVASLGMIWLVPLLISMQQRISIPEIRNHEWFLKNLPADLVDEKMISNQFEEPDQPMQSIDVIMQIISEATVPPVGLYDFEMEDFMDDMDSDPESLDIDSSGEVIYAIWSHLALPKSKGTLDSITKEEWTGPKKVKLCGEPN